MHALPGRSPRRFERGLHDRSHPGRELDMFIRPIRALAPLVAATTQDVDATVEAVESVAASSVVDGLALLDRFQRDASAIEPALTGATPAPRDAVLAELAALTDAADALADLLMAETTYQIAAGNSPRGRVARRARLGARAAARARGHPHAARGFRVHPPAGRARARGHGPRPGLNGRNRPSAPARRAATRRVGGPAGRPDESRQRSGFRRAQRRTGCARNRGLGALPRCGGRTGTVARRVRRQRPGR